MEALRFGIVVPARYASSRLPGKPLLDLGGKPMIVRVLENARRAGAEFVCVATDDARVAEAVRGAGGEVVMTSAQHETGTDRLAEVATRINLPGESIVVNVQGDEPLLGPEFVQLVAQALHEHPAAGLATLATPISDVRDVFNPNVVKVVTAASGMALYFSRAPIPWHRDAFALRGAFAAGNAFASADAFTSAEPTRELPAGSSFLRHIGLYAYRVATLERLAAASPAPPEVGERLEQLRALWLGIPIHVTTVAEVPSLGVDTPEDLERVRAIFSAREG